MASSNRPKIFISHIVEEKEVAAEVQGLIERALPGEVAVFRSSDPWKLLPGENWLERIRKELQEAQIIILMLSPKSVKTPWVNFEAGAVWIVPGKLVIPVCFGGLLPREMPMPYATLQAMDLQKSPYELIKAICAHIKILVPPPSIVGQDKKVDKLLKLLASVGYPKTDQSSIPEKAGQ